MGTDEFFDKLKPWSKRKHRLLGKYLPPFSAKVATTTEDREIYCVDGFAGAAKYDDGSEGSPLLIAKFSDECANWRNPVNLKLINVEPDVENTGVFSLLEQTTQEWKEKGVVLNLNESFQSALSKILVLIGNAPTLFFIDPFGPTYVHFSDLVPILTRRQRITELIINFDTDGLRRIVDAALSENINPKTAQTNAINVSKILGTEGWKELLKDKTLSSEESEIILLRLYKENIEKQDYKVVAYPIRESLDKKPKYHFVYCTRHSDGIDLMNDFVREEEDLIYGEHIETNEPLFQSLDPLGKEISLRREKLLPITQSYFETNKFVNRKQVIKNLVSLHFGQFHSKDYKEVYKNFIEAGKLITVDSSTKIDDRIYEYKPHA